MQTNTYLYKTNKSSPPKAIDLQEYDAPWLSKIHFNHLHMGIIPRALLM